MKILVDSNEKAQAIRGIIAYFDRHGIQWEKNHRLYVGDYMIDGRPDLVVERKKSLQEMAMNLCSPDRMRFYDECRKAHNAGVNLIVLCEHGGEIKSFNDVAKWKNKYGQVTGRRLQDAIFQLQMAYGIPVLFCDKRSTGRRIVEILTETTEEKHGE